MDLLEKTNLTGAVVALIFYLSAILVFILRLSGNTQYNYWIGILEFCLAVPLIYLLIYATKLNRPCLYYVQIILILLWLMAELILDYIWKINFREIRWMVIAYVTLFFAGSGGMIGIASTAGKSWSIISIILFLIMTILAFVQRSVTGL